MTLLGKVFTGLIFVFSVLFFGMALAINATHNKWRDAVMDKQNGYKVQVDRLKTGNQQLKDQLSRTQQEIAQEQGARRATLAALQTQLIQIQEEYAKKTSELTQMQASNTELNQTLAATQAELKRVTNANEAINQQLNSVIADRNANQRKVGALTDQVNEKMVLLTTLEKRIKDLTDSLTLSDARLLNAQNALANAGIKEAAQGSLPNDLRGEVLAVGNNGLIEISLGRDDGVRQGDQLDIYRGGQYLGRLEIKRTEDDKSIGQIVPGFRKGAVQQGDKVSSKLG